MKKPKLLLAAGALTSLVATALAMIGYWVTGPEPDPVNLPLLVFMEGVIAVSGGAFVVGFLGAFFNELNE